MKMLVMFGLLVLMGCPAKVADVPDAAPAADASKSDVAKAADAGKDAKPLDVSKKDDR